MTGLNILYSYVRCKTKVEAKPGSCIIAMNIGDVSDRFDGQTNPSQIWRSVDEIIVLTSTTLCVIPAGRPIYSTSVLHFIVAKIGIIFKFYLKKILWEFWT
jgi:hypothetical protein